MVYISGGIPHMHLPWSMFQGTGQNYEMINLKMMNSRASQYIWSGVTPRQSCSLPDSKIRLSLRNTLRWPLRSHARCWTDEIQQSIHVVWFIVTQFVDYKSIKLILSAIKKGPRSPPIATHQRLGVGLGAISQNIFPLNTVSCESARFRGLLQDSNASYYIRITCSWISTENRCFSTFKYYRCHNNWRRLKN